MQTVFRFADDLGPFKVIHVYEPRIGLKGTLVVDNVAVGPAIGGLRMAPDVSTEECFRLARAMTLKNAAAGLRHGGGKSVLYGDPKTSPEHKEQLIRAMACALGNATEYIFGPDMGTDERCMAWIHDEIGRAVGLPASLGGIPLDELGATGWGVRHAAEVAAEFAELELNGARLVVQGFGSVGMHAARFLAERGVVLVGAADSRGAIYNANGLDVGALIELKRQGGSVIDCADAEHSDRDGVIGMDCDLWLPAARPDVITEHNCDQLKAKVILQGANIPCTDAAETRLHQRGVLSVPDFICNAGGVICAAVEYQGGTERQAFDTIADKVRRNTGDVLKKARATGQRPRNAAVALAEARVREVMALSRWAVF